MSGAQGYRKIYKDLMEQLSTVNITTRAERLGFNLRQPGQAQIEFLGIPYRIDRQGIQREDHQAVGIIHASILAGYLLQNGYGEPAHRFVPLSNLTGMVPPRNSYVNTALESSLSKMAEGDFYGFQERLTNLGGRKEGEGSGGGKSWTVHLLPKIPVQLIYYAGDDEFPPETSLLFDITAVNFLEFEFLAVLTTLFVDALK